MSRYVALAGVIAAALVVGDFVQSHANAQAYGGYGMMGPGMMGPGMMGPMMGGYGYGMGPGMMGWGYGAQANLNLSTDDVRSFLDRWVATTGNPHIKSGPVTEKDANTITAEILTTDKDALVQRFNVDRHTGLWQPVR